MSKPVAIITGGASGIGLAVTTHLHKLGYRVVIFDLNSEAGHETVSSLGVDALFIRTDVSDYTQQARSFKQAFEWGGNRLDFCHAYAGIDDRQSLGVGKEINTKTLDVNLEAVVQGLWLFKYYARRSEGVGERVARFVATSSAAGLYSMPTNPQYTASKYGIVGLTRAAGPVFAKESITVNCICPGVIATNLCPPEILQCFPKEHITPLSTVIKAIDAFLGDDGMTGLVVELSQENICFRDMVEGANESQKWLGTKGDEIWDKAYESVAERKGY
ncbi:15-hydroxyprostaglandin dehydrogenase [Sporormia fimetaria CBS 119925]|uniref:15-hydroxyprostaglandin dehydrogenase n=1 Tax=Sporormia fimetaria CBS 119925 TaxID=1340428 RepID=A0A6A6VM62_9PLEO|nr:15-hydroxyprostaglandin dehydrogenase [Sporormia fimetaria CBS 119925]